jgi:hypothetical protein
MAYSLSGWNDEFRSSRSSPHSPQVRFGGQDHRVSFDDSAARSSSATRFSISSIYGHPVYFAETFIDRGRFRGTCYRTANWKLLGLTTGRGKDDMTHRANRSVKEVLGYPLTRRFRELLSQS